MSRRWPQRNDASYSLRNNDVLCGAVAGAGARARRSGQEKNVGIFANGARNAGSRGTWQAGRLVGLCVCIEVDNKKEILTWIQYFSN